MRVGWVVGLVFVHGALGLAAQLCAYEHPPYMSAHVGVHAWF